MTATTASTDVPENADVGVAVQQFAFTNPLGVGQLWRSSPAPASRAAVFPRPTIPASAIRDRAIRDRAVPVLVILGVMFLAPASFGDASTRGGPDGGRCSRTRARSGS